MADLPVYSGITGQYPTSDSQFATRGYVLAEGRNLPLSTQTANYTLVLGDEGKCVEVNSSSATTVTVPLNSSVAFPVNTRIWVRKMGTGNVSVAGAGGVTISWASSFTITTQYTMAVIHKRASDSWVGMLIGS